MTQIFFVRHAQPDDSWKDDRTRPLTSTGLEDAEKVTELFMQYTIDYFFSSPYKRSFDTISGCAALMNKEIITDERFRERQRGEDIHADGLLEKRWGDFTFCESGGESLQSVQERNIGALHYVLTQYKDKTIVIGTHGTALSTILNYYDNSFNCDSFKRIWLWMPYIIRLDFDGIALVNREELLSIERGY